MADPTRFGKLAGFVAAGFVLLGGLGLATAQACEPCCRYQKTIVWESRSQPVVSYCSVYDHCGHPQRVPHVDYRTVQVPVVRLVKVCH